MKRMWLGLVLLAALAAGGLYISREMETVHDPIRRDLAAAARAAEENDWDSALSLAARAEARWRASWPVSACLTHHGPMEKADALFARLEAYGNARAATAFSACCGELSSTVHAAGEAGSISLWNLL